MGIFQMIYISTYFGSKPAFCHFPHKVEGHGRPRLDSRCRFFNVNIDQRFIKGFVGDVNFGLLTAYICRIRFIEYLTLLDSLVIGALVSNLGQYGDLFESMLKCDAGVKIPPILQMNYWGQAL